jgi:hypothetical protein
MLVSICGTRYGRIAYVLFRRDHRLETIDSHYATLRFGSRLSDIGSGYKNAGHKASLAVAAALVLAVVMPADTGEETLW